LDIESLAEYPGLVPAAWVRWIQAIDFADIEDCLVAARQMYRHQARLTLHPVWRKRVPAAPPAA
jgi:hypothetical protein